MCMGCAEAALMNGDAKMPDSSETMLYLIVFALWIVLLTHIGTKKKGTL